MARKFPAEDEERRQRLAAIQRLWLELRTLPTTAAYRGEYDRLMHEIRAEVDAVTRLEQRT